MQDIPETSFPLERLRYLNLSYNKLRAIPLFLSKESIPDLWYLNLSYNKLKNIDPLIGFEKLRYLNVSDNKIQDIPKIEGLLNLPRLEILDLCFNEIPVDKGKEWVKFFPKKNANLVVFLHEEGEADTTESGDGDDSSHY